jgi:hypothetical protein
MSYLNDFINTLLDDGIQIIQIRNKLQHIENSRIINCETWDESWESVENLGLKKRRIFSLTHQNFELFDAHEMYLNDANVKTMKLYTGVAPTDKEHFNIAIASINHMVLLIDTRNLMKDRELPFLGNKNEYDSSIYKSQTKSNLESDFKVKGITIIIY